MSFFNTYLVGSFELRSDTVLAMNNSACCAYAKYYLDRKSISHVEVGRNISYIWITAGIILLLASFDIKGIYSLPAAIFGIIISALGIFFSALKRITIVTYNARFVFSGCGETHDELLQWIYRFGPDVELVQRQSMRYTAPNGLNNQIDL